MTQNTVNSMQGGQARQVCPHCHQRMAAGSRFCPNCGAAVNQQPRCPHCHNEVPAGAQFCPNCGGSLVNEPPMTTCKFCGARVPAGAKVCPRCHHAFDEPVRKNGTSTVWYVIAFVLFIVWFGYKCSRSGWF